jgi:hypothetical protein
LAALRVLAAAEADSRALLSRLKAAVATRAGALWAAGAAEGPRAGVGAPGVGTWDPGLNQPGAMGNVGVGAPGVGVGAPGAGVWDPGINQPGAIGNTGPARRSVRR